MSFQDPKVLLGTPQLVDGHGHDVVGHRRSSFLVEVVADARSVSEELFDGHLVRDQGQVLPQDRTSRGGRLQTSFLDQAHHGERGEALRPAGDGELRVRPVGNHEPAMG
jgi:hypothetical protein